MRSSSAAASTRARVASPIAGVPPRPNAAQPGIIYAVIETPKGSANKLDFAPALGVFTLKKVLPAGNVFPFDFGFVPGTLGGDGDPLDVLLLLDEPTFPGVIVEARVVGAFEVEQTRRDGRCERNDRIVAVANASRRHAGVQTLDDVGASTLDEFEHFFRSYTAPEGKQIRFLNRAGPERAQLLVDEAIERGR